MLEIRFFATLRENRGKVQNFEYFVNLTGRNIINHFQIDEKDVSIFLVNGFHQPLDTPLKDNDVISIFPPVGGG